MLQIINKICAMSRYPKPHAFDFLKDSQIFDTSIISHNESMTERSFDEIDAVLESYQRELIFIIQRMYNILSSMERCNKEHRNSTSSLLLYHSDKVVKHDMFQESFFIAQKDRLPHRFSYNSYVNKIHFSRVLCEAIVKWLNWDHESETSSAIFEAIINFDRKNSDT